MTEVQGRVPTAVPPVGHGQADVVAEEGGAADPPASAIALQREQPLARGHQQTIGHDSTPRQGRKDVDLGVVRDRLGQRSLVPDRLVVHERDHVVPERPVLVEDVSAKDRVDGENVIEELANIRPDGRHGPLTGPELRVGGEPAGDGLGEDDGRLGTFPEVERGGNLPRMGRTEKVSRRPGWVVRSKVSVTAATRGASRPRGPLAPRAGSATRQMGADCCR